MLNSRERKTMFITSMISIAFALVIIVPWSLKNVLKGEIIVKVWVLPLIGLVLYLLNLSSKYRNYRPSIRYTTVTSYFPLFSIMFASLANGLLMLLRTSRPFASHMGWLWMVIFVAGLLVAVGLLSHFFYRAVIVFSKNETMLIDSVLAVLYLGCLFLMSSIANKYNALSVAFVNTSPLLIVIPIVLGLLLSTVQVLSLVHLYISNPEYTVESKKALIEEFMAMHKREYDKAEKHLLENLYRYSRGQLGIEEAISEEIENLKKEKEALEAMVAEYEAKEQTVDDTYREKLLALQERLAQLQIVLGEVQVQYAAQENAVNEERKSLETTKSVLDDEKSQLKETKAQVEAEKSQLEETKTQVETEKSQLEETKTQVEIEKAKLEEAKAQVEAEKAELEEAKAQIEAEKSELEETKTQVETEKAKLEEAKAQVEAEKAELEKSKHLISQEQESIDTSRKELADEKAAFEKEKEEYVPKIVEVPTPIIVENNNSEVKEEPKPKIAKVINPPYDELIGYIKAQSGDIKVVANAKNTQHKFMLGKKVFLIMQKTNSDYRITFLAKRNYAMSLLNKLPGAVSKPTTPKGENWFKITNKGELDTELLQQVMVKSYEFIANPEPKPEPKVFKPTFNKLVKYAGSLPDKEIKTVANAKGNQVKFYLGKKLFLVAQSTSNDYRLTFCANPEKALGLIVKYPGTVVKATSPKGDEWFKFTNKGEFDEKEIKAMIKQAVIFVEEQQAAIQRAKEEEKARIKAEKEAIKLAEKEAAKVKKAANENEAA